MTVHFLLSVNRQGKTRIAKWFNYYTSKEKTKITRELFALVVSRPPRACNVVDWRECKIIYKRYASLFFIVCVDRTDNELIVLETVHLFVCCLDLYFEDVNELDVIYNFEKVYNILDEVLMAGELQETSKKRVMKYILDQDNLEKAEIIMTSLELMNG
eukprot:TRINITY_DN259_c0_g1_i3.p1 TRINITY_DN259_c0_g1~~TRINITY_DN259_c0_g1_i3.p1  ORF type:complete len:158 (-),score=16.02 TRINITY_DN259_c0_g1_i3:201-674(-)